MNGVWTLALQVHTSFRKTFFVTRTKINRLSTSVDWKWGQFVPLAVEICICNEVQPVRLTFSMMEYFGFHLCAVWPSSSFYLQQRGRERVGLPLLSIFQTEFQTFWGLSPLEKPLKCSMSFITYFFSIIFK